MATISPKTFTILAIVTAAFLTLIAIISLLATL